MVLTDEIWYIVRNTRGVTGFVGPNSKPVSLSEEELALMGLESSWEPEVDYDIGDSIKVISGPLESFIGTVEEINFEKKKVKVLVSMFGRERHRWNWNLHRLCGSDIFLAISRASGLNR
jgi:transcriptional antiterminator NusG